VSSLIVMNSRGVTLQGDKLTLTRIPSNSLGAFWTVDRIMPWSEVREDLNGAGCRAERPWTWGLRLESSGAHPSRDSSQRLVPRLDMDVRSANSAKSNSNALFAGRAKRPDSCALYNLR